MKRLRLLKNLSDEVFNVHDLASSIHCFIASSLSALYEIMPKSPYNIPLRKDEDIFQLCYVPKYIGNLRIFFENANINHRFIASLH
jgi:hypothetical protein